MDDDAEELFVRERLIRGAITLIEQEGCSSLGVRRLAQAADRTTMCVYTKFGSRAGLLTAVYERAASGLTGTLAEADDPSMAYREWALAKPQLYALLFDQPLDALGVPDDSRHAVLDEVVGLLSRDGRSGQEQWMSLHGEASFSRIAAPATARM
jgi:AcrR family transcriptional regulator